jgi:sn-glycerol 3-phosphate transport system substrate-binding protein
MYYPIAVGGPLTKVMDSMIDDFEQSHPDIHIKAVYAGNYNDTRIKALAALKAGEPVQLSVLFSIDMYELLAKGLIAPFDSLATTTDDKAWLKSFYPALMENGTYKGKTYGIPFQRSTIVLYYNKDAFRDAGLDPNKPPATWNQMLTMGKKLVKKDSSGHVKRWGVMIPSTGYPYWMFGALAMENGKTLMSEDGKQTHFDDPAVVAALQYWKKLSDEGVMPKGIIHWGTLRQNFLEGKTAIMWHSTGNLTAVKDSAKFDFGVAMLPANKQRGTPTGGGNFYIFKQASPAQRKAAFTFIKWMTSPKESARWSIATGYIGTSPAAYKTKTLKKYVADFPPAAVARDQLKYATAELATFETGRVRKYLNDAIQAALTGRKTPEKALKQAQKQANAVLSPYR